MTEESSLTEGQQHINSIAERLLETRRKLVKLAQPATVLHEENAAGPSAITHPFYDCEIRSRNQDFNRRSVQRTIEDLQKGIQTFLSDASKEYPSDTRAEDFSVAAGVEDAEADVSKKSNERRSLLVSFLREQSNHCFAVSKIRDDLDGIIEAKGSQSSASLEAVMICAIALEDNVSRNWPTSDVDTASKGLDDAVKAFESIAKEMQLESFAEQHETGTDQQSRPKEYTITFAARILVIDVDLKIEQEEQIWKPRSNVRISYATDSSNGNDLNRFRNAKLAELLRKDVQAIANAIFGCTNGNSRESAVHHVSRLQAIVKILKRLDDLSETVSASAYPDLFALMEDVSEKLAKQLSSSSASTNVDWRQHDEYPYTTIFLHGRTGTGSEGVKYTLTLDIGRSVLTPNGKADEEEAQLPELQSKKEGLSLQYLIRLQPALAMQLRDVRRISKMIGVQPKDGDAKSNTPLQNGSFIQRLGLLDLVRGVNTNRSRNSRAQLEAGEEAILLNCIPVASLKQFMEILPLLQEQASMNAILSTIYPPAGQSDDTFETTKISVDRSELDDPIIRVRHEIDNDAKEILSAIIRRKDGKWIVEGEIVESEEKMIHSLAQEQAAYIANLVEQPNGGLHSVITRLQGWAKEITTGSANRDALAPAGKRLKRRSSEAGLVEQDADSLRPTNRPRNDNF